VVHELDVLVDLQNLSPFWSPSATAAKAFTIDTEEQISRNVLNAVRGTFSTAPGWAHGWSVENRRMM
jgi:hypothetical protein